MKYKVWGQVITWHFHKTVHMLKTVSCSENKFLTIYLAGRIVPYLAYCRHYFSSVSFVMSVQSFPILPAAIIFTLLGGRGYVISKSIFVSVIWERACRKPLLKPQEIMIRLLGKLSHFLNVPFFLWQIQH